MDLKLPLPEARDRASSSAAGESRAGAGAARNPSDSWDQVYLVARNARARSRSFDVEAEKWIARLALIRATASSQAHQRFLGHEPNFDSRMGTLKTRLARPDHRPLTWAEMGFVV